MVPLIIDAEFRALIPPLRPEERAGLEASLRAEGCRDPIVVWHNIIVDGHNRYDICEAHKILYETTELDSSLDREAVKLWIRRNQLARRNLTDDQRAAVLHELLKAEAAVARRERARKGGKGGGVGRPKGNSSEDNVSSKLSDPPKERSRKALAAAARVPERAVRALGAAEKAMSQAKGPKAAKELIASVKDGHKTVKQATAEAKREVRHRRKTEELQARAEIAEKTPAAEMAQVIHADSLEWLSRQRALANGVRPRLIFADTLYNEGIRYGDHCDDNRPRDLYLSWCWEWIELAAGVLADDGSMWLLISDRWAAEFKMMLERAGLTLRAWIIWYEGFGPYNSAETNFGHTHRHLLYAVKDPKQFVFNPEFPEIRRPSDRQAVYADSRANPDGRVWGDTWGIKPPIPRLTDTCDERVAGFPTQLPLALLLPIVACASNPGDLVVDPFSGSAATGVACIELGRQYIGIELSQRYADLSRHRLKGCRPKAGKEA
jgi:site-specific DNA-methyltransferase (adenine-specific)